MQNYWLRSVRWLRAADENTLCIQLVIHLSETYTLHRDTRYIMLTTHMLILHLKQNQKKLNKHQRLKLRQANHQILAGSLHVYLLHISRSHTADAFCAVQKRFIPWTMVEVLPFCQDDPKISS